MNKTELRSILSKAGIKQWQIAEALGIREENFSRKLRHELNDQDEKKVLVAIEAIVEKKEQSCAENKR